MKRNAEVKRLLHEIIPYCFSVFFGKNLLFFLFPMHFSPSISFPSSFNNFKVLFGFSRIFRCLFSFFIALPTSLFVKLFSFLYLRLPRFSQLIHAHSFMCHFLLSFCFLLFPTSPPRICIISSAFVSLNTPFLNLARNH